MPRARPKSQRQYVLQSDAAIIAAGLSGALPAKPPKFIAPQLALQVDKLPGAAGWLHEVKIDGYRLQLNRQENDIRCYTRRGQDWSKKFPPLVRAAWKLEARKFVLDGEVAVPDAAGIPDFAALVSALHSQSDAFIYYAFDILYIDGWDLRKATLLDRKRVLAELIASQKKGSPIVFSEHVTGDAEALWRDGCKINLEGIVSKRAESRYHSGERSRDWVKRACRKRDTFTVAGLAYDKEGFDGIYLGRKVDDKLFYAGKCEVGIGDKEEKQLQRKAGRWVTKRSPLSNLATARKAGFGKARWLKPKLLVEIEFRGTDGQGRLRHASFKGLRDDI